MLYKVRRYDSEEVILNIVALMCFYRQSKHLWGLGERLHQEILLGKEKYETESINLGCSYIDLLFTPSGRL